jgi:2-methylisocitrate lyase-like PEP mutase family enzyme
MPHTQADKAARFLSLHHLPQPFAMPNAWDAGSARVLAGMGFPAIATSSGAAAMVAGKRDGQLSRQEALAHAAAVAAAVSIPVSADLENGFGDAPDEVSLTIRLAAHAGLAGASIEDATGRTDRPQYDLPHAVARIAAAAAEAHAVGFPFVLTARAENFIRGNPDLDDTIRRLVAYEKAGADVLFAPGLPDLAAVRAVCSALTKPYSFMVATPGKSFTVQELTAAGVKRFSFATSLYRAAMTGLIDAAKEIREHGTFRYLDHAVTTQEITAFFI